MKKTLMVLSLVFVCMLIIPSNVKAGASVIDIKSTDDLAKIGVDAAYPSDGDYKLTENIVIDDSWTSKVDSANPFTGTFDGNNHTITYTVKCKTDTRPKEDNRKHVIFDTTQNAEFKNLNMVVDTVNMRTTLVYEAKNTKFTNINVSGKMQSLDQMGGLVLFANSGTTFKNVESSVDFTLKGLDFTKYYLIVGGIAGQISTDDGDTNYAFNKTNKPYSIIFENSKFTGSFTTDFTNVVDGSKYYYLGGLFGCTAYASPTSYYAVKVINSNANATYNYTGTLPSSVKQFYYIDNSGQLQATYDETNIGGNSKPIDELKMIGRVHQNIHLELVKGGYTYITYGYYGDDNIADNSKGDGEASWSTISAPSLISIATAENKNEGKITGLDKNLVYEYKLKTSSIYTTVSGKEEITGLVAGVYNVRIKNNNAKVAEIEVKSTKALIVNIDAPKPSEIIPVINTNVVGFSTEAKEAIQNGTATLNVEITNIDATDEINKSEIDQLKSKLKVNDVIATIFDIDLTLNYENKSQNITELTAPKTFTIEIPESLQNKGYNFYLINNHDNVINTIDGVVSADGKTFTFATDEFSLYALAYNTEKAPRDVDSTDGQTTTEENPKTSDNVMFYVGLGSLSLIGLAGMTIYLKKKFY